MQPDVDRSHKCQIMNHVTKIKGLKNPNLWRVINYFKKKLCISTLITEKMIYKILKYKIKLTFVKLNFDNKFISYVQKFKSFPL